MNMHPPIIVQITALPLNQYILKFVCFLPPSPNSMLCGSNIYSWLVVVQSYQHWIGGEGVARMLMHGLMKAKMHTFIPMENYKGYQQVLTKIVVLFKVLFCVIYVNALKVI